MKIVGQFRCDTARPLDGPHLRIAALHPVGGDGEERNARLIIRTPSGAMELGHLHLSADFPFEVGKLYEIEIHEVGQ